MKILSLSILILTLATNVFAKEIYITIGSDAVQTSTKKLGFSKANLLSNATGISVLKIDESKVKELSKLMHDKFNRCGGFIVHDSLEEAKAVLSGEATRKIAKSISFVDYSITKGETVRSMVSSVKEFNIREMIKKLSAYNNRYYKSQTGIDSQAYVKKTWENIAAGQSGMKVENFVHNAFPQPSVIMTIEGTSKKDEIIVIGGHGDSIAGSIFGRKNARAPGADDNASGIATITEVMRVLVDSGFKSARTIKFMSYAAEEVGLLGSKAIAQQFKAQGQKVVGVVQFDMTNHKGSKDLDIVFMNDFTNAAQNEFMGSLIDTYLPSVNWGYSRCGYGCSDHASWHNAGYPASMPFESTMGDINSHIHKKGDTIDVAGSNGTADHAQKFAKLGVAFLVEMGK